MKTVKINILFVLLACLLGHSQSQAQLLEVEPPAFDDVMADIAADSIHGDGAYRKLYLEAICRQLEGNLDESYNLFMQARELKPDAAEVYFHLAPFYDNQGLNDKVLECLEKAVQLAPNNDYYLEQLAIYHISNDNDAEAIDYCEQLYARHRHRTDLLQTLLNLYSNQDDYEHLESVINRMELVEGTSEELTMMKMQLYSQQGQTKKIQNELRSLIQRYPNDSRYRLYMAEWLLAEERPEAALKEIKTVLREEPNNTQALATLISYYRSKKQYQRAYDVLLALLRSDKTDASTRKELVQQYLLQEDDEDQPDTTAVLNMFDAALSAPQEDGYIYYRKAAYMMVCEMDQARICDVLRQALAVEPDNFTVRNILVDLLWQQGDYQQVNEECRAAQDYFPDDLSFYFFQALGAYQCDDKDTALDALRRGLNQVDSDSDADMVGDYYSIMGDILHEQGFNQQAFEAYDSCLQWKPNNVSCMNNYAYYLALAGERLDKAEQMSYKTIQEEPENTTYLDTYAWILFLQQRYEEARAYIERAINVAEPFSDVVAEHAGDIFAMTGDIDKAMIYWQRALEDGNDSEVLKEKIKQRKYIKE